MATEDNLYNNWNLEGYNQAYGNTGNTDRFPNQGNLYKQFDQDMNFRGPDPFGSFRSGIGSFYNTPQTFPGQRSPHEGFDEFTAQAPAKKSKFDFLSNLPTLKFLKKITEPNTPEENFGLGYFPTTDTGQVNYNPATNVFGDKNVASGFGEGLAGAGQKRIDRIQETITNLPKQWSRLKASEDPNDQALYAQKLAAHQQKLAMFKKQLNTYNQKLAANTGQDQTVDTKIRPTNIQPIHQDQDNSQKQQYVDPGYSTQGGFTGKADPTSGGVREHHGKWADGGRIGYQGGELVEQETDFLQEPGENLMASGTMMESPEELYLKAIKDGFEGTFDEFLEELERQRNKFMATGGRAGYQGGELVAQQTDLIEGPQGGEEFQETVVEGQEQPSREQLEALAMEIFQLPLDDLDDQQLLVVYQEAMQGQPMEEAVQEEDVQFAAQGGLAGLL